MSTLTDVASTASQTALVSGVQNKPLIHLHFLDGLRGLAALYVVLYHCPLLLLFEPGTYSPFMAFVQSLLGFGHFAVAVFIVLSGYVLMLPVSRSTDGRLRGGRREFARRRARRILPAYYGALGLSVLVIMLTPLKHDHGFWGNLSLPFTARDVVVHLLLVQDFSSNWVWKINSPLWSVAMEWYIYFVFALFLLPLWRRRGMLPTFLVAAGMTILPYCLLPRLHKLERVCPWYLALFVLGMAAAEITYGQSAVMQRWRTWQGWNLLFVALLAGAPLLFKIANTPFRWAFNWMPLMDTYIGLLTAIFITCLAQPNSRQFLPRLLSPLLQHRWVVGLGGFSYSLYLIHFTIIGVGVAALRGLALSKDGMLLALLCVVVPLCLLCAYGFHLLFEKPFANAPGKSKV